jgi:hypothetical protein
MNRNNGKRKKYLKTLPKLQKFRRRDLDPDPSVIRNSVVDPYSFFPDPDPDPEFDVGDQYGSGSGFRIRIQYGSRALRTKN